YLSGSIQPLVVNYEEFKKFDSWNKDVNPSRSWYTIDAEKKWPAWVDRLHRHFEEQWRITRIYGLIMLSKQSITFDSGLMPSLLLFWNPTHKIFTVPCGLVGITIEDVMSITNLSPTGVSCFDSMGHDASSYPLDPSRTAYSHFWMNRTYFPVLAREPSGPFENNDPFRSSYGEYLMNFNEGSNDFKPCFNYLSTLTTRSLAEWMPFVKREYGPYWY
ncbi:PMD domain-containing protein, partial [Cephalotus follicularis]